MPTTRPGLRAIAIALTAPLFVFSLVPARAQLPGTNSGPASDVNGKPDHFDLRGIVVNSVTNEPVAGALVELLDAPQSRFSSADGTFVFSNLPVGDHQLNATKPGFSRINGRTSAISYSSTAAIDGLFPVRLTPEAIVYGEVKNEAGEPLEGVTVTLIRSGVVEGHRVRQSLEQSITDDEGNFRIASISPGSFRLFFLPANHGWSSYNKIVHKKQSAPGYGTEYYPGVPDLESSTPIQLHAGSKLHVTQSLSHQHLYEISGVVRGTSLENSANLQLQNSQGEDILRTIRLDEKTGEFQIPDIAPGSYTLFATASTPPTEGPSGVAMPTTTFTAVQPIHLSSDLEGVVLSLAPETSVPIEIRNELSSNSENPLQVVVSLECKELPQFGRSLGITYPSPAGEQISNRIYISAGTYSFKVTVGQPAYVSSLRSGSIDLFHENLVVGPGSTPQPIEITIRNDSAQLTVTPVQEGPTESIGVLLLDEDRPAHPPLFTLVPPSGSATLLNIAPGKYRVVAMANPDELEYSDSVALQPYLAHATAVTVSAGEKTALRVEVQKAPE
jgi:hypothetical protein